MNILNNKLSKHSPILSTSLNIVFGLLFVFFVSMIFTHSASASGETYTYGNSGAQIGGTGGVLGTKNVLFNKSATTYVVQSLTNGLLSNPTYNTHPIFVAESSKNSTSTTPRYMLFSGSVKTTDGKSTCMAAVNIFIKFGDSANGLVIPATVGPEWKPQDKTTMASCTIEKTATISEFNYQNIKIGGSTSSTQPVTDVTETAETRQISVTVFSNKPAKELPSGIKANIISISQNFGTSFSPASDPLSFDNEWAVKQVFFKNVTDGTYKICITPENIFSFDQCQTVTKGYAYLDVYFGSKDTAFYIDGKVVEATVSIAMPSTRPVGTYGPKVITLEDANSKALKDSNTDSYTLKGDEYLSDPIVLKAKFDDIEPGSYKVCLKEIPDSCSAIFTKKINTKTEKPDAQINITADKSTLLLTAPSVTASCGDQVPGMGWILCPIISGLTSLNDTMWGLISSLLKVNPINQSDAIYNAWATIRNLANIVFVIIFLIMIFSQLSSVGISNYGVKKLLPRLLIGAILVNVSFIIVQISVDLANIIGSSLYDLLSGLAPKAQPTWGTLLNLIIAGGLGAGLAVAGVALVGGAAAAFWMLLPIAAIGALGLLAAVLTLIFRQAIIPVLAILAPLAFVAYLLPNTESWFKKWRNLFMSMLVLYPLAAIIFGGAQFAAGTIIGSGSDWWKLLIGLIMLTLPLFSLPFIAAKSGSMISAVGGALNGLVNKSKAPISKATGGYAERARLQANNRSLTSDSTKFSPRRALLQRNARLEAIKQNQEREMARAKTGYIAGAIGNDASFLGQLAGGVPGARVRAESTAQATRVRLDDEEMAANESLIRSRYNAEDLPDRAKIEFEEAVNNGETARARAAQKILLTSGAPAIADLRESVSRIKGNDKNTATINALRGDINAAGIKGKDAALSAWGYKKYDTTKQEDQNAKNEENLGYDGVSVTTLQTAASTYSGLTPVELAGQDAKVLGKLIEKNPSAISSTLALSVLNNPNAAQSLTEEKRALFQQIVNRESTTTTGDGGGI